MVAHHCSLRDAGLWYSISATQHQTASDDGACVSLQASTDTGHTYMKSEDTHFMPSLPGTPYVLAGSIYFHVW